MKKKDMHLEIEFCKRVRKLRKEQGYSQEEFAFTCSLLRTYIGQVERGEKTLTLSSLNKISKGLKMSMAELLERVE